MAKLLSAKHLWIIMGLSLLLLPIRPVSAYFDIGTDEWELEQKLNNVSQDLDKIKAQQRSDATSKYLNTQMQLYKTLRAKGFEVFFPKKYDSERKAVCTEAHSSAVLDTFCICDEGYGYNMQEGVCTELGALLRTTKSMIAGSDEELQRQIGQYGKGSAKACQVITNMTTLMEAAYGQAGEKLQNVNPFYATDIQNSMQALQDYLDLLNTDYDEQCTQKAPQNTTAIVVLPPDVGGNAWFSSALSTFVDAGYIPAEQSFRPADMATREEFIRLIVELNGGVLQELPSKPSFDDVPVDSTAFGWFEEAAKEGWVTGQGDCYGKHPCNARPGDPVNRAEAAALIIRAFGLTQGEAPAFDDAPAGAWYADIIRTAASKCILQGDSGSRGVRPAAHMNRAEMVMMLWRVDRDLSYPNCSL